MNKPTEKEQIHKSAELCKQFYETVNWILSAKEELDIFQEGKQSAMLNYYRDNGISIGMAMVYSLCVFFGVVLFNIFFAVNINIAYIILDMLLILTPIIVHILKKQNIVQFLMSTGYS